MRLALVGDWLKLGRGLGNLFSDVTRGWYLQGFYENHYFTKNELIDDFMFKNIVLKFQGLWNCFPKIMFII